MANVVVVGAQWGDEGKGKIVDWLSERADIIVRFQVAITLGIPWSLMERPTNCMHSHQVSLEAVNFL